MNGLDLFFKNNPNLAISPEVLKEFGEATTKVNNSFKTLHQSHATLQKTAETLNQFQKEVEASSASQNAIKNTLILNKQNIKDLNEEKRELIELRANNKKLFETIKLTSDFLKQLQAERVEFEKKADGSLEIILGAEGLACAIYITPMVPIIGPGFIAGAQRALFYALKDKPDGITFNAFLKEFFIGFFASMATAGIANWIAIPLIKVVGNEFLANEGAKISADCIINIVEKKCRGKEILIKEVAAKALGQLIGDLAGKGFEEAVGQVNSDLDLEQIILAAGSNGINAAANQLVGNICAGKSWAEGVLESGLFQALLAALQGAAALKHQKEEVLKEPKSPPEKEPKSPPEGKKCDKKDKKDKKIKKDKKCDKKDKKDKCVKKDKKRDKKDKDKKIKKDKRCDKKDKKDKCVKKDKDNNEAQAETTREDIINAVNDLETDGYKIVDAPAGAGKDYVINAILEGKPVKFTKDGRTYELKFINDHLVIETPNPLPGEFPIQVILTKNALLEASLQDLIGQLCSEGFASSNIAGDEKALIEAVLRKESLVLQKGNEQIKFEWRNGVLYKVDQKGQATIVPPKLPKIDLQSPHQRGPIITPFLYIPPIPHPPVNPKIPMPLPAFPQLSPQEPQIAKPSPEQQSPKIENNEPAAYKKPEPIAPEQAAPIILKEPGPKQEENLNQIAQQLIVNNNPPAEVGNPQGVEIEPIEPILQQRPRLPYRVEIRLPAALRKPAPLEPNLNEKRIPAALNKIPAQIVQEVRLSIFVPKGNLFAQRAATVEPANPLIDLQEQLETVQDRIERCEAYIKRINRHSERCPSGKHGRARKASLALQLKGHGEDLDYLLGLKNRLLAQINARLLARQQLLQKIENLENIILGLQRQLQLCPYGKRGRARRVSITIQIRAREQEIEQLRR